MAERKTLNKYYPPDFDPSKLIHAHRKPQFESFFTNYAKDQIRMMLPMSVCCNNCGEYIYRGRKFNAKKEEAIGDAYLHIKVWRFYLKCPNCYSEYTIKTDPKNSDYVCESGVSRNFEPWRHEQKKAEAFAEEKAKEEEDCMKAIENAAIASKNQIEIMNALTQIKKLNSNSCRIDNDKLMSVVNSKRLQEKRDENEELDLYFQNNNREGDVHKINNIQNNDTHNHIKKLFTKLKEKKINNNSNNIPDSNKGAPNESSGKDTPKNALSFITDSYDD